ncbi:iron export ABC transporter permease subunit FetB [Salinisphaera sp.]|uniref:ABC transporter permease n=1 Tax=Salinisphaera sp. TaxID=1914330 RepID=UPI000C4D116E|nr:iron export ABC transporter permease subunit FetB [Salinisphaera sp.]MAS11310.1 iron export ABC transporter permease subunit FetB [Salinisphaera sp.]
MQLISLSFFDLALAALAVLALAATTFAMRLGIARTLLIAALRTTAQLALVGLVLEAVFAQRQLVWIALMALVMLLLAGREAAARQKRPFIGGYGFAAGTASMFLSSFVTAVATLVIVIRVEPWYTPQYAIPLLGMLLGNTMTGIALAMDRLTQEVWRGAAVIETRLALGASATEAVAEMRRDAMRAGMIPMLNAMAAAGIISLPGMMTGQILAGSPPWEAVKYQILIMFLIATGTGFGTLLAVSLGARRLFDDRHRLRLDRLRPI